MVAARRFLSLRQRFYHPGNDVATNAVVECPANQAIVAESVHAVLINRRMSDPDARIGHVVRVAGTDVDEEFMQLRRFLIAQILPQMNRGVSNNTFDRSLITEDDQSLSSCRRAIGSADAIDPQKTLPASQA